MGGGLWWGLAVLPKLGLNSKWSSLSVFTVAELQMHATTPSWQSTLLILFCSSPKAPKSLSLNGDVITSHPRIALENPEHPIVLSIPDDFGLTWGGRTETFSSDIGCYKLNHEVWWLKPVIPVTREAAQAKKKRLPKPHLTLIIQLTREALEGGLPTEARPQVKKKKTWDPTSKYLKQTSMFLDYRLAKNEYMSQFWLMRLKWKWAFCLEWIKYSKHSIH
jgi:hypothetical protein